MQPPAFQGISLLFIDLFFGMLIFLLNWTFKNLSKLIIRYLDPSIYIYFSLITIFSAPNYLDVYNNKAAILKVWYAMTSDG